ncbi:NADH-ubiquinone oxidoreductase-F iron-sulfur binding region domain-containing protein [Pseudomonadota bacterium]
MDILQKIKDANIVGRGGADFPAWRKWETAKDSEGDVKYVICNASEGELGVFKDLYILRNHLDKVIKGMRILMDFLETKESYININKNYYEELSSEISKATSSYKGEEYNFHIYVEHPSYIGGETGTILNSIEGKKPQPRSKRVRTAVSGLFGKPTIVHNVETLFDVCSVYDGTFEGKRHSGVFGDGFKEKKIIYHPINWTLKQVMEEAKMIPDFDFYVHVGGSASGSVFDGDQINDEIMTGVGSIEIFDKNKRGTLKFLKRLFAFYTKESCGKCAPCREGAYQLNQMIQKVTKESDIDWDEILRIVEVMERISFCGLGKGIGKPVHTYRKNVLKK